MNIVIAGIGGQGILFVAKIIVEYYKDENIQLCKIFDEGQRNGSVSAHIRINEGVSPIIPNGEADYLFSLDDLEGQRYKSLLKKDGFYKLVNDDNNMFLLGGISKAIGLEREKIENIIKSLPRPEKNLKDFSRGYDDEN